MWKLWDRHLKKRIHPNFLWSWSPKVEFYSDQELRNEFKLFPANIRIFKILFSHSFCHQNAFRSTLWTSLNLNAIILVVSFKHYLNFNIQMFAGNSLNSFLNSISEENSTLGILCYLKRLSYAFQYIMS